MEIEKLLDKIKVPYRLVNHQAVFTVEGSSGVLADKFIIKNLFLKDKSGQYFLVIMPGLKRLDLKTLSVAIDSKRLHFANADDLLRILGVTTGSVSLFGVINDKQNLVKIIVDKDVMQSEEVGFHPNINTATIFFKPDYLDMVALEMGHKITSVGIGDLWNHPKKYIQ